MTVMQQRAAHPSQLRSPSSRAISANVKCLQWTFADLRHASLLLAQSFRSRSFRRGSTLVMLIATGIECSILLRVSAILQLTFAPLDVKLLDPGREEQLRDYMKRLESAVIVVPAREGGKAVDKALKIAEVKTTLKTSLAAPGGQSWLDLASIVPTDGKDGTPQRRSTHPKSPT